MGKISYSMYLVHGPLLFTAGHWFVLQTTALTGLNTQVRYGLGVALSAIPLWIVLICTADLATRTLDKWSLSLGRLLYERLSSRCAEPEAVLPRTN
jgi:peptidoglycan/LPS O-acetylase OafA/YrhL